MNRFIQWAKLYLPEALFLAVILGAVILLASCAQRPEIRNIEDGIVVTSVDIKTVADQVRELCGNTVPDGPCRDGALIDTETKQVIKARLQEAAEAVVLANAAVEARDQFEAGDKLNQAEAILRLIRDELARRQE